MDVNSLKDALNKLPEWAGNQEVRISAVDERLDIDEVFCTPATGVELGIDDTFLLNHREAGFIEGLDYFQEQLGDFIKNSALLDISPAEKKTLSIGIHGIINDEGWK